MITKWGNSPERRAAPGQFKGLPIRQCKGKRNEILKRTPTYSNSISSKHIEKGKGRLKPTPYKKKRQMLLITYINGSWKDVLTSSLNLKRSQKDSSTNEWEFEGFDIPSSTKGTGVPSSTCNEFVNRLYLTLSSGQNRQYLQQVIDNLQVYCFIISVWFKSLKEIKSFSSSTEGAGVARSTYGRIGSIVLTSLSGLS